MQKERSKTDRLSELTVLRSHEAFGKSQIPLRSLVADRSEAGRRPAKLVLARC